MVAGGQLLYPGETLSLDESQVAAVNMARGIGALSAIGDQAASESASDVQADLAAQAPPDLQGEEDAAASDSNAPDQSGQEMQAPPDVQGEPEKKGKGGKTKTSDGAE